MVVIAVDNYITSVREFTVDDLELGEVVNHTGFENHMCASDEQISVFSVIILTLSNSIFISRSSLNVNCILLLRMIILYKLFDFYLD